MSLGEELRVLASLVDVLESRNVEVQSATPTVEPETDTVVANLTVVISDDADLTGDVVYTEEPEPTTTTDNAGLIDYDALVDPEGSGGEVSGDDALVDSEGSGGEVNDGADEIDAGHEEGASNENVSPVEESPVTGSTRTDPVDDVTDDTESRMVECTNEECSSTFDTERGMKIHVARVHLPGTETEGDEQPPYRNPSALRRVYDENATFEEMTKALDVDVSPATVRRYMIKFGVHDPASYGPDDQTDEPDDQTDEAELSESHSVPGVIENGLSVEDVREAVLEASTMFDVERKLDLEHDDALSLLRELDLLELVHGRVTERPEPGTLEIEVDRRLGSRGFS